MHCVKLNNEWQVEFQARKQAVYLPSTVLVMIVKRLQHDGSVTGGGQGEAADVLWQECGGRDDVSPRGEGAHPLHHGAVCERSCLLQWRHAQEVLSVQASRSRLRLYTSTVRCVCEIKVQQ